MNPITDKPSSMSKKLSREITGGIYRAGTKLPGERKLSEYFNVSRNTARIVLNDFEREGIIERRPRSGAYVSKSAVEIIEKRINSSVLQVLFIMPVCQQVNPLILSVFTAFMDYADSRVKSNILFLNKITDNLSLPWDNAVIIAFAFEDAESLKILESKAEKLIIINKKSSDYNYIAPDNYAGGCLMAKYLLENGHYNVGCLLFKQRHVAYGYDFNTRYQGLKNTLEKGGGHLDVFLIPSKRAENEIEYKKAADYFFSKDKDITAIACLSDKMSMYMYSEIYSLKLIIPDQISVIGFDDQYYSQFTCPPLTTVKFPAEALGIKLVNCINEYIDDRTKSIEEEIVPMLINRQSVKNISK
jgi:hypothetical protein